MISGTPRLSSDLWMLAQTAYHLYTGIEPRNNPVKLPPRSLSNLPEKPLNNCCCSIPLRRVLETCLKADTALRPTAQELAVHVTQELKIRRFGLQCRSVLCVRVIEDSHLWVCSWRRWCRLEATVVSHDVWLALVCTLIRCTRNPDQSNDNYAP